MVRPSHDPHLCVGCGNAGNVIFDPGVPGTDAIIQCAVHGVLTFGSQGHSNYMKECELRFVDYKLKSMHTCMLVSVRCKKELRKRDNRHMPWSDSSDADDIFI